MRRVRRERDARKRNMVQRASVRDGAGGHGRLALCAGPASEGAGESFPCRGVWGREAPNMGSPHEFARCKAVLRPALQ